MGGVGIHMDTENAAGATKLVVDSAKVDFLDSKLTEHRGAHDTGLDSDV